MKNYSSHHSRFQDKTIYRIVSKRGWTIVIMPDNIRLDNFHGFPHIHMEGVENHLPITYNDFKTVDNLIMDHIDRNTGINKKELLMELLK